MKLGFLLRPLFPTWRFFEDVGPVATLSYRVGSDAWIGYPQKPFEKLGEKPLQRRWTALFLNPDGNLRLAEYSLFERLVQDIAVYGDEITQAVSYQLVANLVRAQVPKGVSFQFKVALGAEDVLISAIELIGEGPVEGSGEEILK